MEDASMRFDEKDFDDCSKLTDDFYYPASNNSNQKHILTYHLSPYKKNFK